MIKEFNGKKAKIHSTAFVSEFSYLIGDIEIGENSSIWPGVILRADSGKIVIGDNTNIQDNIFQEKNLKRILHELRMTIEELEAEVLSDPSSYKLDVDYQDVLDYENYQDTAEEGL